jgi:hypothetical protein
MIHHLQPDQVMAAIDSAEKAAGLEPVSLPTSHADVLGARSVH